MHQRDVDSAVSAVLQKTPTTPQLGIVLGSGWGPVVSCAIGQTVIGYSEISGFPELGVDGHDGCLVIGSLFGCTTAILCGRKHFYEARDHHHMNLPLAVLKALGCETVLLTNAAGAVSRSIVPGMIAMITDHINLAGVSPLSNEPYFDDPFVDLTNAYDIGLQELIRGASRKAGVNLQEGVYACFAGPHFETPAEIRMAASIGADLVGMSTVSETILARRMGMRVAAFSIATNAAAGLSQEELNHQHVQRIASSAREDALKLFEAFIPEITEKDR